MHGNGNRLTGNPMLYILTTLYLKVMKWFRDDTHLLESYLPHPAANNVYFPVLPKNHPAFD